MSGLDKHFDGKSMISNANSSIRPKSVNSTYNRSKDRYSRVTALELDLMQEREARMQLE